jgi:hypothetical protein
LIATAQGYRRVLVGEHVRLGLSIFRLELRRRRARLRLVNGADGRQRAAVPGTVRPLVFDPIRMAWTREVRSCR